MCATAPAASATPNVASSKSTDRGRNISNAAVLMLYRSSMQ